MREPTALVDERPPGANTSPPRPGGHENPARPWLVVVAIAALLGAVFAAVSTADFIAHLDRQVHAIHCAFIPGVDAKLGDSGCRVAMMSMYSSFFRTELWGGIPVSLGALAVFAYLTFQATNFVFEVPITRRHTGFLVAATLLPISMSAIYGFISITALDSVCKLCVGIYAASAVAFGCALAAHAKARPERAFDSAWGWYTSWFLQGVVYVGILAAVYVLFAPVNERSVAGCGTLTKKRDPARVITQMGGRIGTTRAIAVIDPLCPACRAFDRRLHASGLLDRLEVSALLFPLDSTCNWMVEESIHPGACAVSEAMLCQPRLAPHILAWAYGRQEELLALGKGDPRRLRKAIAGRFPDVRRCLGSARVRNKLNKSLRWAVANALPVLTPQLFVEDRRVCDEDTDLGLEFTVSRMLARSGGAR